MDPDTIELLPLPIQIALAIWLLPLEMELTIEEAEASVIEGIPDVFPEATEEDIRLAGMLVRCGTSSAATPRVRRG